MSPDTHIKVRRSPKCHMIATYKHSDIWGYHWSLVSGGVKSSFMGSYSLYAYVWCDGAVEGAVVHSGEHGVENHGPCPHQIKVCILKKDNRSIYDALTTGPDGSSTKPEPLYERARPSTGNFCKKDIHITLSEKGPMREVDLTEILYDIGHNENNIKAVLKKQANLGVLVKEQCPRDRRYNVYRINE